MKTVDHTNAILQYRSLAFHQSVRWQPTVAFPDAHRAARGLKPHPDLFRGVYCILQPAAVRIHIQVVRA